MPRLVTEPHSLGQGSTKHPPPATQGTGTGLTYGHSKQRGAAGCIQCCQRSSRWGLSRCCKTKNGQGTLRQTGTGSAELAHRGEHLTAVVRGSHTERRARHQAEGSMCQHTSAHGITPLLHHTLLLSNQSSHCHASFSHTQPCQKASSEEHVSIRLNHMRQQTIDPLLIHTPQKNSDGSGKLSFSTARVTRGGCKSKTVG